MQRKVTAGFYRTQYFLPSSSSSWRVPRLASIGRPAACYVI
jgi:hypothetical protein